ncbi:MAG: flavodoxin [Clostridia bacterium]|nr:flavodoxin [Clostridia bacterium]
MKTAVVYYSMSGNTEYAAGKIAEALGADLIRVEPVKAYPTRGLRKFIHGGRAAVTGATPELLPCPFDADLYDRVVLCSPVWASNITPPMRSFVTRNIEGLRNKRIACLLSFSGGGADKAASKLRELIGVDAFEAETVLTDPVTRPSEENERLLCEFCEKLK